eukprot:552855_1
MALKLASQSIWTIPRHCFSSRHTLNVVKTGIMSTDLFNNICGHPSNKKSMDKLTKIGIKLKEDSVFDKSCNLLDDEHTCFVGGFHQYPEIAHKNMAKFVRQFMITLTPLSHWRCSKDSKQKLKIDITSTIDKYPFPISFPAKKPVAKNKKTFSKKLSNKWMLSENEYYQDLTDSTGNNMPFLTRNLNKISSQQLLIWRDNHPDITVIPKIEKVFEVFKPNAIILEYPAGGEYLSQYITVKRKISSLFIRLRQSIVSDKRSTIIGSKWYFKNRLWNLKVTDSYAIDRAIEIAIKDKIGIILADYPENEKALFHIGSEILDFYSKMLWTMIEFPWTKCLDLVESKYVSIDFGKWTGLKVLPHFMMTASHRNDMMALAINECDKDKILFISGSFHSRDVIDRLCGNVEIRNPFKNITDRTVELKNLVPDYYTGDSKIQLSDNDITVATQILGANAVKLLSMNNEELDKELLRLILDRHMDKIAEQITFVADSLEDEQLKKQLNELMIRTKKH